jgi:hypothetical protein
MQMPELTNAENSSEDSYEINILQPTVLSWQ